MIISLSQDKVFCIAAMQLVTFVASAGARVMRTNLIVSRSSQHNRIDVPAVVSLAAVGHAPVTEELLRVRVGARFDVLDRSDAGGRQPRDHIAGEIEHETLLARAWAEEARIGGGGGGEGGPPLGSGLIGSLPEHPAPPPRQPPPPR